MDGLITSTAGTKRLRGSLAKSLAVDAEPGAKGGDKGTGDDLTWPDHVSEEVCSTDKVRAPAKTAGLLHRSKGEKNGGQYH